MLLQNKSLNINAVDKQNKCNAFWFAAQYGQSESIVQLAEAGIDVLNKHHKTATNALHVAMQRKHFHIAKILAQSQFPLDLNMRGGLTALIVAAHDPNSFQACQVMIANGAKINKVGDDG